MAAINFGGLSAYVDQISSKLIKQAILEDTTVKMGISIQTGIKGTEALNILSSTIYFTTGACPTMGTASTALTQRNIVTCLLNSGDDGVCAADFDAYWTQTLNPAGSYYDTNPIADLYVKSKLDLIQRYSGQMFWAGSVAGHTFGGAVFPGSAACDGIFEVLEYTAGFASVIQAGTGSGYNTANAIGVVDAIYTAALTDANGVNIINQPNLILAQNPSQYDQLINALRAGNYFNYYGGDPTDAGKNGVLKNYFGKGFDIWRVPGMTSITHMLFTYAENIYMGVDMMNDKDKFELFYDQRTDKVYWRTKWRQGSQVAFPQLCVLYKG